MSFTRRDLFKMAAVGAAASVGGNLQASDDAYPIDCSQTYGVLVDTVVCIGCRKCEWACNNEHKLSNTDLKTFEDKSVFKQHRRPADNAYTVVNEFKNPADCQALHDQSAVHALQPTGLCVRLYRRRPHEKPTRLGRLRCLEMHRLPLLHGGMSIPDSGLRVYTRPSSRA